MSCLLFHTNLLEISSFSDSKVYLGFPRSHHMRKFLCLDLLSSCIDYVFDFVMF